MKWCKCGSGAINDDPKEKLCDRCWRDRTIKKLRKHLAAVCEAYREHAPWSLEDAVVKAEAYLNSTKKRR